MKRMPIITGLCLLSILVVLVIAPLEAQGRRKSRSQPSRKGTAMLTDQEIKSALKDGACIAHVQVESVEVQAPGTRGHQTFYKLKVVQALVGELSRTIDAQRYGAPVLQKGQDAIVVLGDAPGGDYPLQAYALIPAGKQAEVVKAHTERIEKLKTVK